MRGTISPTIKPVRAPITGARTASPASATITSGCALPLALWNGRDPILKERLFGLTNAEGNHGEDVKEYYFYLDNTPTHSYMKYLYKYPQKAYPYSDLVETNRRRGYHDWEYELLDTGVFDDDRYFDVLVEYAKAGPSDLLIRSAPPIAGPTRRSCTCCRHCGFATPGAGGPTRRSRRCGRAGARARSRPPTHELGDYVLELRRPAAAAVYRERNQQPSGCSAPPTPPRIVKDGINDFVVAGRGGAVNPSLTGTKAAAHYRVDVAPGETAVVRLRLAAGGSPSGRSATASTESSRSGGATPTRSTARSPRPASARTRPM